MTEYERVKDTGDLTEVRKMKIKLEEARESLLEQLCIFRVPDAINPYYEALADTGVDTTKIHERRDMILNVHEEIMRQLAVYSEAKDATGLPVLQDWITNISENKRLLYAEIANDRTNIVARIKAGMIPIVMPGISVQIRTWEVAMNNLKPLWIKNGITQEIRAPNIICSLRFRIMFTSGFFNNIPDRSYLVWTYPTNVLERETSEKSVNNQDIYNDGLVQLYPELYDPTDLIPTEYIALQGIFTSLVREHYREQVSRTSDPKTIKPLDYHTRTRFLSAAGLSGQSIPYAHFDTMIQRIEFMYDHTGGSASSGFRPASRT